MFKSFQAFLYVCVLPVSGCWGASHGQPPPSSACPLPGWAAVGPPSHLTLHQAVWTGRSSGGSTQHFPDSAVLAAPPGQWLPEATQTGRERCWPYLRKWTDIFRFWTQKPGVRESYQATGLLKVTRTLIMSTPHLQNPTCKRIMSAMKKLGKYQRTCLWCVDCSAVMLSSCVLFTSSKLGFFVKDIIH